MNKQLKELIKLKKKQKEIEWQIKEIQEQLLADWFTNYKDDKVNVVVASRTTYSLKLSVDVEEIKSKYPETIKLDINKLAKINKEFVDENQNEYFIVKIK